jgi:hypothetical protein
VTSTADASHNNGRTWCIRSVTTLAVVLQMLVGVSGISAASAAATYFNVTNYGAVGNGHTDNTAAFAAAIAAADKAGGGEVYVPPGTYAFRESLPRGGASIQLNGTNPISLIGAGRNTTSLVEQVKYQPLLLDLDNGSIVQHLSLNSLKYTGGRVLTVRANDTLVQYDDILGANYVGPIGGGTAPPNGTPFAVYYSGPLDAQPTDPTYNVGNRVLDDSIYDGVNNDGFSFAFQEEGEIANDSHLGSRLALYVDKDVTVLDYTYTPNPLCTTVAENGFWITAPSDQILIKNFVSSGAGGIIGGPSQTGMSYAISIVGERLTTSGNYRLAVGNVDGLTVSHSVFGPDNFLKFYPTTTATGVVVSHTKLAGAMFLGTQGVPYAAVDVTFDDDRFTPFVFDSDPSATFVLATAGATTVDISSGSWDNKSGGFSSGIGATYRVKDLAGYPG